MPVFRYIKALWDSLEIPRGVQDVILAILMFVGLLLAMGTYLVCRRYVQPVTLEHR